MIFPKFAKRIPFGQITLSCLACTLYSSLLTSPGPRERSGDGNAGRRGREIVNVLGSGSLLADWYYHRKAMIIETAYGVGFPGSCLYHVRGPDDAICAMLFKIVEGVCTRSLNPSCRRLLTHHRSFYREGDIKIVPPAERTANNMLIQAGWSR